MTSHHTLPLHKKHIYIYINQLGMSFMSGCICRHVISNMFSLKQGHRSLAFSKPFQDLKAKKQEGTSISCRRLRKLQQNWSVHTMLLCFVDCGSLE